MLDHMLLTGNLTHTILVGFVVFLVIVWLRSSWKYRNMPPGPRGLPLLGNLLQLWGVVSFREFYKWSKIYGPAITVRIGPLPVVILNNIDVVLEAMVTRGADFANRVKTASTDAFTDGGRDIALGQYGPTWKLQRKISSKALRLYMQREHLEQRIHNALEMSCSEMDKKKEPFDPRMYMNMILTNILCGLCFGYSYDHDDPEFQNILHLHDMFLDNFGSSIFLEDFIPGLSKFPTKKFRKLTSITDELMGFFGSKYQEHKRSFSKDNIEDLIDYLLLAKLDGEEAGEESMEQLTDRHLIQTTMDIFIAGLDTSRFTLMYALVHMAANPDIQTKVQAELDNVLSSGEFPCVRHRPQMAYTEAVLHESMRMASISPTGIPHKTLCDTKLSNYDIPKDTLVIINHWALFNDTDKWTDVDKFIPERYLDSDGKLGPKPDSWLPFSAGRRVCLGETVAKPELHLIFAGLMHRYTWYVPPGEEADVKGKESFVAIHPKPTKFVATKRY